MRARIDIEKLKGNFWRKLFSDERGGELRGGGYASKYSGNLAKRDTRSTRTKLNRLLDKLLRDGEEDDE